MVVMAAGKLMGYKGMHKYFNNQAVCISTAKDQTKDQIRNASFLRCIHLNTKGI